jgi:hypothetical protein
MIIVAGALIVDPEGRDTKTVSFEASDGMTGPRLQPTRRFN